MNEKAIRSFSLAKLIEVTGRRPEDLYMDGCLIAMRHSMREEEEAIDLFRYPSRINAFAIAFCSKGSITVSSDLIRHEIGERTMYVHLPDSILQLVSERDSSVHIILCEKEFVNRLNIDVGLTSQLFLAMREHPGLPLTPDEWTEIMRMFDDLLAEGRRLQSGKPDEISTEIMRMLIRTAAYRICRIIDRHIAQCPADNPLPSRNRNGEYFRAFMEELSNNYTQQRSVGFYAGRLHLTPKYLTTILRKTTGRTAVEWIDDYVILEAQNLLKYSTMSIQEIAYCLNFPNQSFFGKYFKHHTGRTPSAYRMER